jgi:hypothetical protein
MALSDIVNISITTQAATVQQAGFGIPMILAGDAGVLFTERAREYTDLSGLVADFATGTATYKMASALFAQSPRPPKVVVGRMGTKPTPTWQLDLATPLVAAKTYTVKINGVTYSALADSNPTVAEVAGLWKTAIDTASLGITTTVNGTGLLLTHSTAGGYLAVESTDIASVKVTQTTADTTTAADLAAIALENNTWYALLTPYPSKAIVLACGAYAESNKKLLIAATQDSNVAALALVSDTGADETIAKASVGRARTALIYHPANGVYADAALAGRVLPLAPGSETWAFKTLSGVTPYPLTATQRANLDAKAVNWYETIAGVNVTLEGSTSGPSYIDIVRGRDWLEARLGERIFGALARSNKIPYTDAGIAVIEGIVRGVLRDAIAAGLLLEQPATETQAESPRVTVPTLASVPTNDKAARILRNVKFDAILQGAIQSVEISGNIAV